MNAGIELKFIYKMFRDFGIGFSLLWCLRTYKNIRIRHF